MPITESNLMGGLTSPASPNVPQPGVTVFKIDGMSKSIAGGPVTGFALHQVAGFPDKLETADGQEVKNNHDEFKVLGDMQFVTKFNMSGAQGFNPEHKLDDSGPKVDPPHSQTVSGLQPEEPAIKLKD